MCVLSAVEHIFNETAMHAKTQARNRMAKANRASHGPRVSLHSQAKARVKKTRENPKKKAKGTTRANRGAKGSHKGKTSKAGFSGLVNSTSEASSDIQESAQTCTIDTSWNGGWSFDEWNDDWSPVGRHEGREQTYDTSARSFSLGGLDVGATSSPKRFEWVKMNLDTRAAVNTFPLNFGPEGAGDGIFYRTASGEWTLDGGAWQSQGYDENGLLSSLSGRHKVLCSAAEIACKGRQDFYLGHDGGYMIPIHSKIGQGMRIHFEKLVNWHEQNELILSYSKATFAIST